MKTDEQLMLEYRQGSSDAFEQLSLRYRGSIYGFFRRRLDNSGRAEELAQETFLAVLQAKDRYEPRALFRTYLYAIAMHLVCAERRRLRRDVRTDGVEAAAASAADEILWAKQAVAQLDPDHREVLMLREYDQLSYAEIADVLNLPLNTIRTRLFRARMALRRLLAAEPVTRPSPQFRRADEHA